jgi:N-acetylglucosamine kinase-like BadF-type ATPase
VSSLGKKRLEAALAIASYAVGSGAASAAPTPGVEIPKQLILTASDILMYTNIWKIYFEEDLSSKGVLEMLAEVGIVVVAATGTAYIVAKGTTALLNEITDWLGPMGWAVSAAISSSLTGMFGSMWALYCDNLYSQKESQPA